MRLLENFFPQIQHELDGNFFRIRKRAVYEKKVKSIVYFFSRSSNTPLETIIQIAHCTLHASSTKPEEPTLVLLVSYGLSLYF